MVSFVNAYARGFVLVLALHVRAQGGADDFYAQGVIEHKRLRFQSAEKFYAAAVQVDKRHVNAHFGLGNVLINLGQWQGALSHLQSALHIAPSKPELRIPLAIAILDASEQGHEHRRD